MVQSAIVRRSCIGVVSAVRPMIISSPRMEAWGPRVGLPTPEGRSSPTIAIFSLTIWRAR